MTRVPRDQFDLYGKSPGPVRPRGGTETYGDFSASELYCPKCQLSVPVRERLLLILPDGELYEYICTRCGHSVGEKTARDRENIRIVLA
jgi:hypothetical protein